MNNTFDVGVIGMGVAGTFACIKIAKEHKNTKVIAFDLGRPPAKRRRQIDGFLGCLPNSDGKLYINDLNKVSDLVGAKKTKAAHTWVDNVLGKIGTFKTIKDKAPSITVEKRFKKIGYDIELNNYVQLYPKDIHSLSKYMASIIEDNSNISLNFDSEVKKIYKQKNMFVVVAEEQEFRCKKLILAVGRSGWRWVKEVYSDFGIIDSNDIAKFGIRVEMNAANMKEFNKSNCTITKGSELELGPFSWSGTVIPEDHVDLAISSFRSNENRWKSDKVSFSLIGNRVFPNNGFEQTDRIGRLTFVLANDRIIKERISYILSDKSKISIIPEYEWLKGTLEELSLVIPDIITKAHFHVPTIMTTVPQINIGNNLETEIEDMFVVGESAGVHGILAAATMGAIAGSEVCR
jgi:uncharacterized FAD-dependent dehydrogenase